MKLITRLVSIFIAVWLIAMIAYPVFSSNFNWVETQRVWDRWQTLNSGMIALLAAMLAIYATQYIENKKRERSLIAEKSLLPLALSELSEYCIALAEYLNRHSAPDLGINLPIALTQYLQNDLLV
ncbi:hypothetical protein, partial [Aeromonas caviae]|uniref:hypothetical protein n=1 Tax=Aeromonas caviae TaxID=648 RepID=UPI001957484F